MPRLGASVGEGGANLVRDVKYVQFLLCDWRLFNSGRALVVDGIAGPLTKAAIREFQKQKTHLVDGRVDPTGLTIAALETTHVNNITASMTASLSKYAGSVHLCPPALGPLTAADIVSRYLAALHDDFRA